MRLYSNTPAGNPFSPRQSKFLYNFIPMKKSAILIALILCTTLAFSQWPIYFPQDTINFELNTLPYEISADSGNLWQVGIPQKTYLNAAWSPDNAIVTSLQSPYNPGIISRFTVKMPLAYYMDSAGTFPMMSTFLAFRHKYDTDTLTDWCIVEISYDEGVSFIPLKDTIILSLPPFNFSMGGWEKSLSGGWNWNEFQHKVSGHSNEWAESIYIWKWWMPVKHTSATFFQPNIGLGDSLWVRFSFISDNSPNTGAEGWMIDDIITGWADLGGSARPVAQSLPLFQVGPNPAIDFIRLIRTDGASGRGGERVVLTDVRGNVVFRATIESGQNLDIPCRLLPSGLYFCRITADDGRTWIQKVQVLH
jgi:hypothetical protein